MANNKFCCPHCGGKQSFRKLVFSTTNPMPCVHCGTVIRFRVGYVIGFLRFLLIITAPLSIEFIRTILHDYYLLPDWVDLIVFLFVLSLALLLNSWITYISSTFERVTDSPQQ